MKKTLFVLLLCYGAHIQCQVPIPLNSIEKDSLKTMEEIKSQETNSTEQENKPKRDAILILSIIAGITLSTYLIYNVRSK